MIVLNNTTQVFINTEPNCGHFVDRDMTMLFGPCSVAGV